MVKYLCTYSSMSGAKMAKGMLESNGIKSFLLMSSDPGGMVTGISGVSNPPTDLHVDFKDFDRAKEILGIDEE